MSTNTNPQQLSRIHLVNITTTALSALHLHRGQFAYLRSRGFDITAIASPGNELQQLNERDNVNVCAVSMAREIRPFRDLISLFQLWRVLRQLRPDIVNAGTPKAGLIGMLAAWLAGVPVRIYTQRGLRLETCRGFKAWLLTWTERIACGCAHRVIFISNSLRSACLQRKLLRGDKAVVIGSGSSNGVDAARFQKLLTSDELHELRAELSIPEDVPVIGFVGRLTKDKGIEELCEIFQRLRLTHRTARLLIVGDYEAGDPVNKETVQRFQADPNVVVTGFVKEPAKYYQLMSVLAFPSQREGFGNVILEAACVGVPTVGFQATGVVDAIQHQQTGIVVALNDLDAFATALDEYLSNSELRRHHGDAGRIRAVRDFAPHRIWGGLFELYHQLLSIHRSTDKNALTNGSATQHFRKQPDSPYPPTLESGSPVNRASVNPQKDKARMILQARQISWSSTIKRVIDFMTAVFLIAVLWPVMLLTWMVIRYKMGAPAVLRQTRPGLGELPFLLYKFRTMTDERGEDGELLPDAVRLTSLGRILRRLSLDELPQLLNVIKGDMSLVGPRPLRMDYLPYFTERERLRQTVPPGITGWAQIHGRNEAAWDQRLAADVWYVENWSLLLDFKILVATLARVLQRKNVVDDPRSIMLNLNEERAHMTRRAS